MDLPCNWAPQRPAMYPVRWWPETSFHRDLKTNSIMVTRANLLPLKETGLLRKSLCFFLEKKERRASVWFTSLFLVAYSIFWPIYQCIIQSTKEEWSARTVFSVAEYKFFTPVHPPPVSCVLVRKAATPCAQRWHVTRDSKTILEAKPEDHRSNENQTVKMLDFHFKIQFLKFVKPKKVLFWKPVSPIN
jgi:hypothetical protein